MAHHPINFDLRKTILIVALANFAYFGVESWVAFSIGSVSLFADSVDFLEDTSVNLLILIGLGWTSINRARLGKGLAILLLAPALATLWTIWTKLAVPTPPDAVALSLTSVGAFCVNLGCAFLLARFRAKQSGLSRAAFLSARNDVFANVAIFAAGLVTAFLWVSHWPDILVGIAIAAVNMDAAKEVWTMANKEQAALRS
ncbi:MAG: cation transporter [Parvibaculum sp.]